MSEWKDIGTLLLEYGLINNDDIKAGVKLKAETGLRLGEALVQLGKVSMEDIDWVLSKQLNIPYVIVDDINVNIELLKKFREDFLIKNRVLPLYEADDQMSIVIEDPFNKAAVTFIEEEFGKKVSLSTGSGSKIEETLKQAFNKVGLPELIESVKLIIDKIRETSFYRIDFLLTEHSCEINVFGSGILKKLIKIKGGYTAEDIFRAFNELEVPFLYEHSFSHNRTFAAVYPLTNTIENIKLPAIIGRYGLCLPEDTMFSDAQVHGLSRIFPMENQISGYPYIATKERPSVSDNFIYVIDAAPAEFQECYVNACIPRKCPSCEGVGCADCRDLGYTFNFIEGMYSSAALKEKLKEV